MHESQIDRSLPWLVVVNPAAAKVRSNSRWEQWEPRLRELLPQAKFISTRPNTGLITAIQQAQSEGLGGVLAVGGDGTAHLVANAIITVQTLSGQSILFALLPFGTGNDWVKTHGIPHRWHDWKAMFLRGKICWQQVGLLKYMTTSGESAQRYFINVAGLAYDAFVVRELAQSGRSGGKLLYLWGILRCLFRYTPQQTFLHWPQSQATAACYTINIGIGRYSGGGMQLVPQANPQGKDLALTYVKRISRLRVLLNSWRFYRGWVAGLREAHLTTVTRLSITGGQDGPILLEADGEFLGHTPVEVQQAEGKLWFVGK